MAGNYDFQIEQGADFSRVFAYQDASGNAINLTGYSAKLQARHNYSDPTPVISLDSSNNGITINGAAGQIVVSIPAATTGAYNFDTLKYDLVITSSGGQVIRLLEGIIELDARVTQ